MADPDPQDLQTRIALLKGQIQRHKESSNASTYDTIAVPDTRYGSQSSYSPYTQRHSRYSPQPVKNRTLVLNQGSGNSSSAETRRDDSQQTTHNSKPDWIATNSRNAQIVNSAVYNPTVARDRVLDPAAKIRKQAQVIREKLSSGDLRDRHLTVDGIRYSVQAGGNRLVRVKGPSTPTGSWNTIELKIGVDDSLPTPKQAVVSGIPFLRSKTGNLYRSNVVNRNWYDQKYSERQRLNKPRDNITKSGLCKRFSNTGKCSYGPKCPHIHDANKIAICREFLRSGTCSQGQHCDLSHDLTYERVPACVHFDRGSCTKENCPYPHVRINPAAMVCRAFTTYGYCSKGVECLERHVFECPDYAEGKCLNAKCRLPHVDRAHRLNKQAPAEANTGSTAQSSGLSATTTAATAIGTRSDNTTPLDSGSDIDSDHEVLMMDLDGTGFSQEQDFMKF